MASATEGTESISRADCVEEKEEQELREQKPALELARKLAADKQQQVMEQATVVSDLKMQLVELRQDIAINPTPGISEDEDGAATSLVAPPAPPLAVPPAVPLENTPLDPRVMTWMTISFKRSILLVQNVKESSRPFRFLRLDKSSSSG